MATPKVFTKSLAAASSNGIATSQSASAGAPLTLNGSLAAFLSTTSTAAVAPGGTVIPVTSTTGVVAGCTISDSTATTAFVSGTKVVSVGTTSVQIWPPVAGAAGVGSGDTIVFAGQATIDTASANNSAVGRRVIVAYTGTDTSFVVVGTNGSGNLISDTIVGASGAGVSNQDFVTVTSITPVGGGLTGVTAGTNGTGSSPWWLVNFYSNNDINVGFVVEIVSGSVNYTVNHTYDDPNNLQGGAVYPERLNHPVVASQSGTLDGSYSDPIAAIGVTINSGTGVIRVRYVDAGIA